MGCTLDHQIVFNFDQETKMGIALNQETKMGNALDQDALNQGTKMSNALDQEKNGELARPRIKDRPKISTKEY